MAVCGGMPTYYRDVCQVVSSCGGYHRVGNKVRQYYLSRNGNMCHQELISRCSCRTD